MRRSGSRRLHVFCGDYTCDHSVVLDTGCWPASLRLSDLESLYVPCQATSGFDPAATWGSDPLVVCRTV